MATEPDGASFRAFKERMFGNEYMIWHDGLYTYPVERLRGEEREEALAMLRFGLAIGDPHAGTALAAMGDETSREAMLAEMQGAAPATVVRLALAAHAIRKEPELARALERVLACAPAWSDRIDAAIGLRHFAGEEDEAALLHALETDREYLVRYHACESLLARWQLARREITAYPEVFERIRVPAEGEPTDEHLAGYAQARAAMEALRDGR